MCLSVQSSVKIYKPKLLSLLYFYWDTFIYILSRLLLEEIFYNQLQVNPLNQETWKRIQEMFQPNMFENLHHHHHLVDMSHKTPENSLDMPRDDDHDSRSGTDIMEAPSGDDQDPNQPPNKKKRYHRHTQHQIQEMES